MTKFKIGDTVRVKSLEWYNENKNSNGFVHNFNSQKCFSKYASSLCGKEIIISEISEYGEIIAEPFTLLEDWMLEEAAVISITKTESNKLIRKRKKDNSRTDIKEDSAGSVFMNEIRRLKAIEPSINALSKGSNIKFSGVPFDATETDIIASNSLSCSVDWEQYRFDLIKAVLPALVQGDNSAEHCAKKSIEIADEVIKLLKDEKNISDGI